MKITLTKYNIVLQNGGIQANAIPVWHTQPQPCIVELESAELGGWKTFLRLVNTSGGITKTQDITLQNIAKQTVDLSVCAQFFEPIYLSDVRPTTLPSQNIDFYSQTDKKRIAVKAICMGSDGDPRLRDAADFDVSEASQPKCASIPSDKFIFSTRPDKADHQVDVVKDWTYFDDVLASEYNLFMRSNVELKAQNYNVGNYNYSGKIKRFGVDYTVTLCYTLGPQNTYIAVYQGGGNYVAGRFTIKGDRVVESITFRPVATTEWDKPFLYAGLYQQPRGTYGSVVHWATIVEGPVGLNPYKESPATAIDDYTPPLKYTEGEDFKIQFVKSIRFMDLDRTKTYHTGRWLDNPCDLNVQWLNESGSWDWMTFKDYTITPGIAQSKWGGMVSKTDIVIQAPVTETTLPMLRRLLIASEVSYTVNGKSAKRMYCSTTAGLKETGSAELKVITLKFTH